ncbi:helix-turn-helix domain-containing protein [Tessaracoccus sp.]|uniref:helix-turn-helix domain-containing protein n=1 Tax=Tessaracoccus sp. TaxID=1971211 RepID=UPI00344E4D87
METARAFGANVRTHRQARRLSQEGLAYRAGITKNQVQLIEAGRAQRARDRAYLESSHEDALRPCVRAGRHGGGTDDRHRRRLAWLQTFVHAV